MAVSEDRVLGVPRLLGDAPQTEVILLDDVFQHRAIRPGLSILITEYANLFTRDALMPLGWLRESKSNYHRADIIIVSRCPGTLWVQEKEQIIAEIKPFKYQKVYFSKMSYGQLYSFINWNVKLELGKDTDVLLVCGIAKFEELKAYLQEKARNVYVRPYRDHHNYDRYDVEAIRETFNNLGETKKVIITTEKDAARLSEYRNWFLQNKIEIFVQPITVEFLHDDGMKFDTDIFKYMSASVPGKIIPAAQNTENQNWKEGTQ